MNCFVVLDFSVVPTAFNEQPPEHDKRSGNPDSGDDDGGERVYPDICAGVDRGVACVGLLLNIAHALSLFLRLPKGAAIISADCDARQTFQAFKGWLALTYDGSSPQAPGPALQRAGTSPELEKNVRDRQ